MRLFEVGQKYKTNIYKPNITMENIVICTSVTDYMVTFRDDNDNLFIGKLVKDYDKGECLAILPNIFAKDIPVISTINCIENCQLSLY